MSDETEAAPPKSVRTISLTRGAAYILEGVLQEVGPCTTPNKVVKWSKLWQKLRRENDRKIAVPGVAAKVDFERTFFKDDGEAPEAFQRRVQAHNDAFDAWKDEPLTLTVTEKQYDTARAALKWVHEHQKDDRCTFKFKQSTHLGLVFEALGLDDDDTKAE